MEKRAIELYGYIGIDVLVSDFARQFTALETAAGDITLKINSVGGQMFDGIAMYNTMKASKRRVIADVVGLSASMATIVMLAANKVRAASNAMVMVHGPRGGDYTTVEGLENLADLMKKMRLDMARIYSRKTGKPESWIIDNWLADGEDHWFTAAEAKAEGLIDEVYESLGATAAATWGLKKIAAFYNDKQNPQPNPISMKKIIAVLTDSKLLTLPENAGEELVAEGIQSLVARLSATQTAMAAKDAEIARLAAEVEATKTNALKSRAVALVDAAVASAKITAAQKEKFVTLASATDEAYSAVKDMLDSMLPYQPVSSRVEQTDFPRTKDGLVALHDEIAKGKKLWSDYTESEISAIWEAKHGKKVSASTLTALKGK